MSTPPWLVSLVKKTFPGRFLMARATNVKPVGALVKRMFFDGDDLFYVPPDQSVSRIAVGQDRGRTRALSCCRRRSWSTSSSRRSTTGS